eukprot:173297-Chlamydomonas_euryale.AAC.1
MSGGVSLGAGCKGRQLCQLHRLRQLRQDGSMVWIVVRKGGTGKESSGCGELVLNEGLRRIGYVSKVGAAGFCVQGWRGRVTCPRLGGQGSVSKVGAAGFCVQGWRGRVMCPRLGGQGSVSKVGGGERLASQEGRHRAHERCPVLRTGGKGCTLRRARAVGWLGRGTARAAGRRGLPAAKTHGPRCCKRCLVLRPALCCSCMCAAHVLPTPLTPHPTQTCKWDGRGWGGGGSPLVSLLPTPQAPCPHLRRYAVLVTDVNQNALVEGARLWGFGGMRQEGEGMLSMLLPASWRRYIMHNYASEIVVRRRRCARLGGGGHEGRGRQCREARVALDV